MKNIESISPETRTWDFPDPRQLEIWKNMTKESKLELFLTIMRQARQMKRTCLAQQFPHESVEEIDQRLAKIFLHART
jgi:hypothetical protein